MVCLPFIIANLGEMKIVIKKIGLFLVLVVCISLMGCGGKIRYSQSTPEAKDFRPERIAVLAVDTDAFPAAEGIGEQIITDMLEKKHWYAKVESPAILKASLEKDEDLKKTISEYLKKLKMVNFSDPDLSKKIGEILNVQAFFVGKIDLWNYSIEDKKKFAKVGMEIRLIDAATGKVIWRANHNRIKDYWLFKPDLSEIAKGLVKDIINYVPR